MTEEKKTSIVGDPLPPARSLPFPPKPSGSYAGRTLGESTYSPLPPEQHLGADAPNILVILIDDAGPALPAPIGGKIHTPTLGRIREEGIGYNRFHTTSMCSPTRWRPRRAGAELESCRCGGRSSWRCGR